ncbi:IS110 family transposase [Verrucosispora sioxanthis]|uniref:IS110 family transposase n=1 Tax=Verrucosispora sioxanthis TaxID=2499994 RepID=UPI00281617F2|nr:transposase [Verrucosispora sioxanthis]
MSLEDGPLFFVGIDWATTEHAVRVLDRTGRKVAAFTIEHAAAGFTRLNKLGDTKSTPVAIERPDWLLIGALLEAGHPVMPVNPNAIIAAVSLDVRRSMESPDLPRAGRYAPVGVRGNRWSRSETPSSFQSSTSRALWR